MQNTSNNAKPAVLTRSLNEIEKKKIWRQNATYKEKKLLCRSSVETYAVCGSVNLNEFGFL